MDLLPVLAFLRQKIGLNPDSIGPALVEKSIREQMKITGATDADNYLEIINSSPTALKHLIESVVIPETSFFRNRVPFHSLKDYVKRFFLNRKLEKPLRILCLPCSTGEEAYSIAMVLLDLKMPSSQFHIFAADINEQALLFARAGIYSAYSFRGDDLGFRDTYFSKQGERYILNQNVRDAVHFEQANLLSDHFLHGHKPYDIIFCRNLLIYFDGDIKEKAIKALTRHLASDGVLFVGHAEGAKIPQYGYASLDYPMSFAFARKEQASIINAELNVHNTPVTKQAQPAPVIFPENRPATSAWVAPVMHHSSGQSDNNEVVNNHPEEDDIAQARKLAKSGAYNEVMALCETLLSRGSESAEVYYLLGQAGKATGNNLMAEENLKKAIYLDADFYEALVYLSRLYEQLGNPEKAAAFLRRAERVKLRKA